jgi:myo-inositol-1(or 4)-monophosphatase
MAHVTHVYPWDFVAAGILGQSLGYSLVRPDGSQPTYEGREYLLFIPTSKLEEVKGYLSQ